MAEEEIKYYHQTVDQNGKRKWLYPLIRIDFWYKYRSVVAYVLLGFLFAAPYIKINGHQFLLFNIIERKFILFGQVFWPQDFFIIVLMMLTGLVGIVLFTSAFGRIFCGWVCPQTIFLEMVFRRIEVWIEGEPAARKKLDNSPWTQDKIIKKTSKHIIYVLISFFIANTFLAYVIGTEELWKIMTEPITLHLVGFISIWLFTAAFYYVFAHVRELVCIVACPYGRLQGVLLDKNSLVVAYHYLRGEPRGRIKKNEVNPQPLGDCVDCNLCVAVCPTGIDIREGTQLECVNCTACIDACNQVMDKVNRPRNLIGYYSEEMIKNDERAPKLTLRMKAYGIIILIMIGVSTYFILSKKDIDVSVLRAAGTMYQEQPNNFVSNLYTAEVVNKSAKPVKIDFAPESKTHKIQWVQPIDSLAPEATAKVTFFLLVPQSEIKKTKTSVALQVLQDGAVIDHIETNFLGPVN
ncbi:cytochrome c oxidase accessory protein CcoG [Pedobacter arcticus]|uniref:cytochrome c oxidase accessory protein CcoG n=1 Tax=Pedobacter arcticus TaxID=752140 RepID=UPI0002FAA9FF|nr:cytochrome c oxidase accessory protein CcoG [Pedobacter arcticus]